MSASRGRPPTASGTTRADASPGVIPRRPASTAATVPAAAASSKPSGTATVTHRGSSGVQVPVPMDEDSTDNASDAQPFSLPLLLQRPALRQGLMIAAAVLLIFLATTTYFSRKNQLKGKGPADDDTADGDDAPTPIRHKRGPGKAVLSSNKKPAAKRTLAPRPTTTAAPTVLLPGQCVCPKTCVHHDCGQIGTSNEQPKNDSYAALLPTTVQFSRCTECVAVGGSCGVIGDDHCNREQKALVTRVQSCLTPGLHPPSAFTVQREAYSGLSVVCRNDTPLAECQGVGFAALRDALVVKQHMDDLGGSDPDAERTDEEKETAGKKNQIKYLFIDVGANDPLLDLRLASLPNVAVKVFSMVPELRNVVSITACVNKLPESTLSVETFEFSDKKKTGNLVSRSQHKGSSPKVILRFSAPGYFDAVKTHLDATIREAKPNLVLIGMGNLQKDNLEVGKWMLSNGFIGFQQASCSFIRDTEGLTNLAYQLKKGDTLQFVSAERYLHPQCAHACTRLACVDSWRTEYQPCERDDVCFADEKLPCDWKIAGGVSNAACQADHQWPTVQRCLDPLLPVARFSVVAQFDMLVACRGTTQCDGVDIVGCNSDTAMLTELLKELAKDKTKDVHFVMIGNYVGMTAFRMASAMAKLDGNHFMHMFDANPTTRQWQKTTRCMNNIGRTIVYDFAIGERDEQCSMVKTDKSDLGATTELTCPAAPIAASMKQSYVVQQFHTLDSVLGLWSSGDIGEETTALTPRNYVVFFDGSLSTAGKLLESAVVWLGDKRWQPAAIVLGKGASLETAKAVATILNRFDYMSSVELPGIAVFPARGKDGYHPRGTDSYVFMLKPAHHHGKKDADGSPGGAGGGAAGAAKKKSKKTKKPPKTTQMESD